MKKTIKIMFLLTFTLLALLCIPSFSNAAATETATDESTLRSAIENVDDGGTANAKSVLSVLGACIKCGDEIELICDGADEQEAMKALTDAISGGLGE